ncbi:MAG: FtsX-like permease family protein [Bacteriovorax sp.]|jgi:ABC-type lipoprotein release transport system permease subunit
MKAQRFKLFLMLFLDNSTTVKFALGVLVGMAFSIAVILSTMGIMDGFDRALKRGLKRSVGDLSMYSRHGFFNADKNLLKKFENTKILQYSALVQTESFLIFNDESRGVLVKGIDENYGSVVGLPFSLHPKEVAIGSEIAKINQIKIGDEIVLAFGKGNAGLKSMPALERFTVATIIEHGIYQKDSRLVYVRLDEVQRILGLRTSVNLISFNIPESKGIDDIANLEKIESYLPVLRQRFGNDFLFKPYWREFAPLIEAVKAEKVMISLILQMVVVISIFNILAFIIFINEKKSKELFLFKALGMSRKAMSDLWMKLVMLMWVLSCLVSILFVKFFEICLMKLSLFELPSEIYYMPRIELYLSWKDYLFVFSLALVWIMVITYYLLRRLKQKSLLEGLRQEFA